ncbi:MAG: hypothetical protein AB7N76_35300 [Planctomycetota bacterium]
MSEPCCPWPTYCECAQRQQAEPGIWGRTTQVLALEDLPPATLPRAPRNGALDLSCSGDSWELVLAQLNARGEGVLP